MLHVDKLNVVFTAISIIVTLVSIYFSVKASQASKAAGKIKHDVLELVNVLDFKAIVELYRSSMLDFRSKTRALDWYKGREVSPIIDPFESAITKLNAVYPIIDTCSLKEKVDKLLPLVRYFDKLSRQKVNFAIQLMEDIDRELQKHLYAKIENIEITKNEVNIST